MKLSFLLNHRLALVKHAHLANLAYAYERLGDFSHRIATTGIKGKVRLQTASPEDERFYPTLTLVEGSRAFFEELFDDIELLDFAYMILYVLGEERLDLVFRLEELESRFLTPLRYELSQAGVAIDQTSIGKNNFHPVNCPQPGQSLK